MFAGSSIELCFCVRVHSVLVLMYSSEGPENAFYRQMLNEAIGMPAELKLLQKAPEFMLEWS